MSSTLASGRGARKRQRRPPAGGGSALKRLRVIPPTEEGHARFLEVMRGAAEAEAEKEEMEREREDRENKMMEEERLRRAAERLTSETTPETTPEAASSLASASTLPAPEGDTDTPRSDGAGSAVTAAAGSPGGVPHGGKRPRCGEAEEELRRKLTAERLHSASRVEVTAALVGVLEGLLERGRESGEARTADDAEAPLRRFFSTGRQDFSLESYVARIVENVRSRPVLVACLVYIDRLREAHVDMTLSDGNLHRVLTVAVLLGYKVLVDEPCGQEFFRAIGGIPSVEELNGLEGEFLRLVDWKLFVHRKIYDRYATDLLERVGARR